MRKLVSLMLGALLFPAVGYPLGLGEIRLQSGLNQTLSAEIDLLSVTAEEADSLKVGLASSEMFEQVGITRAANLQSLQFTLAKRSNGTYYIRAQSEQPIREPVLDFLLEVNWSAGRLLREYTVLLDPPQYTGDGSVAVQPPSPLADSNLDPYSGADAAELDPYVGPEAENEGAVAEAEPGTEPSAQPDTFEENVTEAGDAAVPADASEKDDSGSEATVKADKTPETTQTADAGKAEAESPKAEKPEPAPKPMRNMGARPEGVISYGPVRKRETLWKIAHSIRPDSSVTVNQVMVALIRSNPKAFVGNNINRLKTGQVLRLDPAKIAAISRAEATRQVAMQGREWDDYRRQAAGEAASRTPSGATAAERSTVVAKKPDEPRLKLVAPQGGSVSQGKQAAPGVNSKDADAIRKELMLAIETNEAQKQENEELRKRFKELEGQKNTMERLITLKDNELAGLQGKLADNKQNAKAPAEKGVKPSVRDATTAQPAAKVTDPKTAEGAAKLPDSATGTPTEINNAPVADATGAATTADDLVTPPGENATAKAPQEAKKPVAKKPPQRKNQEPTPIVVPEKSFVDQLLDNPLLKNPLLLGGGLLVFVLLVIFIIHRRRGGGGFQESILMGGTSSMIKAKGEAKSSEEASFFSDFAVSGMGSIHAEDSEVDPLTEADTYMAYQKYDLAEESLREAIRHHDRPELRAKLLEVFHASKNEAAFESEAIRLHQMVNGRGSLWNKAVALGSEIIPNHALFSGSGGKFVGSHGDARLDNEVLDIGLDLDALTAQPESSQGSGGFDVDLGVDFSDISEIEEKKPARKAPAPVLQAASAPATEEFDLGDLDMNFEESAAGLGSTSADESMSLDSDVSLDFGDLDLGHDASDATPGFQSQSNDLELGYGNDIELGDIDLSDMDLNPASESHSSMGDTMDLGDLNDFQLDAPAEGDALFADLDETGTKLDLARAYVEMGDADGARSILDEVIHEGNSAQKQQAQQLLQQIA